MLLKLDAGIRGKFPGLYARMVHIRGVGIRESSPELEEFKTSVLAGVASRWTLDGLKEEPVFRLYRDFFWKIGVDPTKTRPASEALIRRVLRGNPLPRINTLVDAYNLASLETTIPFGAFDLDRMRGELVMREGKAEEKFLGIGMEKPITLAGGEVVVEDDDRLVAVYPYRDADHSRVTAATRNVLLMTCGVSGVLDDVLAKAERVGLGFVTRFNGGSVEV